MGIFTPSTTDYVIKEGRNINIIVTYVDDLGDPHNVTITPNFSNDTINIINGVISGYYSNVFDPLFQYRLPDYSYNTTTDIFTIPQDGLPLIYRFQPDGTAYFDFEYTASANGETAVYTVTVLNDWNAQQSNLIELVNPDLYHQITVRWINNINDVLPWGNDSEDVVNWRTETWPWP